MRNLIQSAVLTLSLGFCLSAQTDRVPAGSEIVVRTNDAIDARYPSDGRIYTGVVDQDVMDSSGKVVIPRGSNAELIAREMEKEEIVVDLDSVQVNGRRYRVDTQEQSVTAAGAERKDGIGANERTGKYVGGGALIGSIIGAIAGGGKGAAIGAATGAGAGAVGQTVTRGGAVRLPSESLLTFRLDRALRVDTGADPTYERDGRRYRRDGYRYNNDTRSRTR